MIQQLLYLIGLARQDIINHNAATLEALSYYKGHTSKLAVKQEAKAEKSRLEGKIQGLELALMVLGVDKNGKPFESEAD